jgi:hypothetical protein
VPSRSLGQTRFFLARLTERPEQDQRLLILGQGFVAEAVHAVTQRETVVFILAANNHWLLTPAALVFLAHLAWFYTEWTRLRGVVRYEGNQAAKERHQRVSYAARETKKAMRVHGHGRVTGGMEGEAI